MSKEVQSVAYRMTLATFRPESHEGALLYSGRWHIAGDPVIYAADSLCTCYHEIRHRSPQGICFASYHYSKIIIPADVEMVEFNNSDLPQNWSSQDYIYCQNFAKKFFIDSKNCIMKVPSARNMSAFSYVIRVDHPSFSLIKFEAPIILSKSDLDNC